MIDERIDPKQVAHMKFGARMSQIAYGNVGLIESAAVRNREIESARMIKSRDTASVWFVATMKSGDVIVSARGTNVTNRQQIWENCRVIKIAEEGIGRIHLGLREQIDKVWHDGGVYSEVRKRLGRSDEAKVYVFGHSQGGGLAQVATARLMRAGIHVGSCTTQGSMNAGDEQFANYVDSNTVIDLDNGFFGRLHLRNNNDIVTAVPTNFWFDYHPTGKMIYILPNDGGQPHLKYDQTKLWMLKQRANSLLHGVLFDGFKDHPLERYIEELERL